MFSLIDVQKKYGHTTALEGISFEVKPNEILGIIGPDGSGKTTLFRIMATLLLPDLGIVKYSQYDVIKEYEKVRKFLGYMPGRFSLYADLTVEENLQFFATIYGTNISENYELIEEIYKQLLPFKNRLAGKLSGGMKQKLALCCALIHRPQTIILDEPTTGVDAVSRREFWNLLHKLKSQGVTILVSTPYMDEANQCDRVIFLQNGKILNINSPAQIIKNYSEKLYAAYASNTYKLKNLLLTMKECKTAYLAGQKVHFITYKEEQVEIIKNYLSSNFETISIEKINPSMEDCYIQYMLQE